MPSWTCLSACRAENSSVEALEKPDKLRVETQLLNSLGPFCAQLVDVNTRDDTHVLEIRDQRLIVRVDLLDNLHLSHQFFESLSHTPSSRIVSWFTSTLTALLELSDARTFERYPLPSLPPPPLSSSPSSLPSPHTPLHSTNSTRSQKLAEPQNVGAPFAATCPRAGVLSDLGCTGLARGATSSARGGLTLLLVAEEMYATRS